MPALDPQPGEVWKHMKTGNKYEVTGFVLLSTDNELDGVRCVVYQRVGKQMQYATPVARFQQKFTKHI